MDALNLTDSRKLSPIASMQRLEQAILHADQRSRIRRDVTTRAQLTLAFSVLIPVGLYWLYHTLHPNGVLQNHKSSAGNYMLWAQTFLYTFKPQTQIWRPEFYNREMQTSLLMYSRKIEKLRKEGAELPTAGVHFPKSWH